MTPHLAYPEISFAQLERELGRELEQRKGFYPGRVDKGNMLQAEADAELARAAAWLEDCRRIRAAWSAGMPPTRPQHGLTWNERRGALLRELDFRARFYPEWIDKGRLEEAAAPHQIACLKCLLAIYEDGFDWFADDGKTPLHSALAEQQFNTMRAGVDAREGRAQQELALP